MERLHWIDVELEFWVCGALAALDGKEELAEDVLEVPSLVEHVDSLNFEDLHRSNKEEVKEAL